MIKNETKLSENEKSAKKIIQKRTKSAKQKNKKWLKNEKLIIFLSCQHSSCGEF